MDTAKGRTLRIKEDRDIRIGHIYTDPELIAEDSNEEEGDTKGEEEK